jgi:hypothetical protein
MPSRRSLSTWLTSWSSGACGGPAMPDETPEQWAARSRREQALSECVEDPATVANLALAVLEASEGEARWL